MIANRSSEVVNKIELSEGEEEGLEINNIQDEYPYQIQPSPIKADPQGNQRKVFYY